MATETSNNAMGLFRLPPKGPFTSDPRGSEAWYWTAFPLVLLAVLTVTALVAPDWYLRRLQPEGYGLLELSHFFIPAITAAIALATLGNSVVRKVPLLVAWFIMLALGCIYIAGEEHSWGQHFFQWSTPEYWRNLNSQQETNLHNVSDSFGKLPRSILFAGIVVMGFIYPLLLLVWPGLDDRNPLAICMPPLALLSAALAVIAVEIADHLDIMIQLGQPAVRLSEMSETFIYLFLLLGVVILRRRILEVSRRNTS